MKKTGNPLIDDGYDLYARGDYHDALVLLNRALEKTREGKNRNHYAMNLNVIAAVHSALLEYKTTLLYFLEAKPVHEKLYGKRSMAMARLLFNMADTLNNLKAFDEARKHALESCEMFKALVGLKADYGKTLVLLGTISCDSGDAKTGLIYFENAHPLVRAGTHDMASFLNSYSSGLVELKRWNEALKMRLEQVALMLRLHGPDHPDYAMSLQNTALLYVQLKQGGIAIDYEKRALAIWHKRLGPDHPRTILAHKALLMFYRSLESKKVKNDFAKDTQRVCSMKGCHHVEAKLSFCMACQCVYFCKAHETEGIKMHIPLCHKFGDELAGDRKRVKCRRCRKRDDVPLLKCSACMKVHYCSVECSRLDWQRHKHFCGLDPEEAAAARALNEEAVNAEADVVSAHNIFDPIPANEVMVQDEEKKASDLVDANADMQAE